MNHVRRFVGCPCFGLPSEDLYIFLQRFPVWETTDEHKPGLLHGAWFVEDG
jgi:hypothetical protein